MVVSERLIWLHIPKTAGDSTLRMFARIPHGWRILDPHTDPQKHGTLADAYRRAPGSESCRVMINLRRLPDVLLSYFHHMQRHGPDQHFANGRRFGELAYREYLHWVLEHPENQTYDWILNHHLGERDPDHCLRVDDLAASFLDVVGLYHEIPDALRADASAIRANVGGYDRGDLTSWFTRDEMTQLYRNCPRWTRSECAVYGRALVEEIRWDAEPETAQQKDRVRRASSNSSL